MKLTSSALKKISGENKRSKQKAPSINSTWTTSALVGGSGSGGSRNKKLSLLTYNKLVGEADGGKELPEKEVRELLDKYKNSWENRIYVNYCRTRDRKECVRITPQSGCMCGHAFRSHEWYAKTVGCRVPGCKCECFNYLPRNGSRSLRCTCKHLPEDHRGQNGLMGTCSKKSCKCTCFKISFSCLCGDKYNDHSTVIMTAEERRKAGLVVDQDIVEKRLETIRSRKKASNKFGCGRCVACKCGMACKKGNKNPWHDPSSATLAVSKHMSNSKKVVNLKKGEKLQKSGPSKCNCAVQGRVCKC
jgi:hypothetical protein